MVGVTLGTVKVPELLLPGIPKAAVLSGPPAIPLNPATAIVPPPPIEKVILEVTVGL